MFIYIVKQIMQHCIAHLYEQNLLYISIICTLLIIPSIYTRA